MELLNDGIKRLPQSVKHRLHLQGDLASAQFLFVFVAMAGVDSSVAARVREALDGATDDTLNRMQTLEQERRALNGERKRLARELKNESQKRRRLLQKARNLSIDDLLQVAMTRSAAKAKAKAKAVVRS